MRNALLALSLLAALPRPAAAQTCFDGDFGTRLGADTFDTVFPMQPIGFAFPFAGQTYTDIHVNDHGFVELSNGGTPVPLITGALALYTPTPANFVTGAPKIAPLYCDMELTGGGECFLRSSPTACVVTWSNARSFGIAAPRFSFQLVLAPSGTIRFVYGPGVTNASAWGGTSEHAICGATPAGGAVLPAPLDLSAGGASPDNTTFEHWTTPNTFDLAGVALALLPTSPGFTYVPLGGPTACAAVAVYGAGCDGMALRSVGLPSLGNPAFTLRSSGVPAVSPLAFVGFGTLVVNPGAPLDGIGMAGCSGYTNLDLGVFTGGPVVSGVSDSIVVIPANPALVGAIFSAQALALSAATSLGLAASNGARLDLGN
jgi:hypothetical protein